MTHFGAPKFVMTQIPRHRILWVGHGAAGVGRARCLSPPGARSSPAPAGAPARSTGSAEASAWAGFSCWNMDFDPILVAVEITMLTQAPTYVDDAACCCFGARRAARTQAFS